jgi:hypothetical protein
MKRLRVIGLGIVVALPFAAGWAMFAPIDPGSREQAFDIPAGTYARRVAGDKAGILPPEIHLTVGVKDVLVVRNLDQVPQTVGPILVMPGQTFRLPFNLASDYQFVCTAHSNGKLDIVVDPEPTPGWRRLVWRVKTLIGRKGVQ